MKTLLYCRDGAEHDLAEELRDCLKASDFDGIKEYSGAVILNFKAKLFDAHARERALPLNRLIFARQVIWVSDILQQGDRKDFVNQVMERAPEICKLAGSNAFSECIVETTGSESSKDMNSYCKSLQETFEQKLNRLKILPKGKGAKHLPRLHIALLDQKTAAIGWSDVSNSSPWQSGIPRLRQPQSLISRSYMKLEETYLCMLNEAERQIVFPENANAVDLGAAPGGWSQFLLQRNISVTAIDNANISEEISNNPLFKHRKENALKFVPKNAAYLLVCDVVEKPNLIEEVLSNWIKNRWCKHFVVNFKLPMKHKYPIIRDILDRLGEITTGRVQRWEIKCKQLYHDRDEVTLVGVSLTADRSM